MADGFVTVIQDGQLTGQALAKHRGFHPHHARVSDGHDWGLAQACAVIPQHDVVRGGLVSLEDFRPCPRP